MAGPPPRRPADRTGGRSTRWPRRTIASGPRSTSRRPGIWWRLWARRPREGSSTWEPAPGSWPLRPGTPGGARWSAPTARPPCWPWPGLVGWPTPWRPTPSISPSPTGPSPRSRRLSRCTPSPSTTRRSSTCSGCSDGAGAWERPRGCATRTTSPEHGAPWRRRTRRRTSWTTPSAERPPGKSGSPTRPASRRRSEMPVSARSPWSVAGTEPRCRWPTTWPGGRPRPRGGSSTVPGSRGEGLPEPVSRPDRRLLGGPAGRRRQGALKVRPGTRRPPVGPRGGSRTP